jgi:hypothetical protein
MAALALVFSQTLPPMGTSLAQTAPEGDFFNYPATLLNGMVTAEVQRPPADCRKLCIDRSGCVGYDYSLSTNMCRMFGLVTSAKEDRPSVAATRVLILDYQPPINPPEAAKAAPQPAPDSGTKSRASVTNQDRLIERYRAYIGEADLYNSNGVRLTHAWEIVRQDRANFHKLGRRDDGDEPDNLFADPANREALQDMVRHGSMSAAAANRIVNGNVWIGVSVYRSADGRRTNVTVSK